MKTLLALAALTVLALGETVAPAFAQATPPTSPFADPACPKLAEVEAILSKQHETFVELDVKSLIGVNVTPKVLVSTFVGKYVVFGYEDQNGCVTGPTPIAAIPPQVGA
jgi:hypothetical protein